jgi:hypothetical protein
MPSLFAVPFSELTLADLDVFMAGAEPEPLLWEAKGGQKLDPHAVRRQCGGFANSHEGGYLILGATEAGVGKWTLDGWPFPEGEAPRWVTSCLQEGVRPVPRYDVRTFRVDNDHQVAVVEVQPLGAGPCIVRGTVYERVPGATIPVKEPGRLADLFTRGEQTRTRARHAAENARAAGFQRITAMINREADDEDDRASHKTLMMAFGMAAATASEDIAAQLFRESTRDLLLRIGAELGASSYPVQPNVWSEVAQDRRMTVVQPVASHQPDWAISAFWDGSVGVACRAPGGAGYAEGIVNELIARAQTQARNIADHLGADGPTCLDIVVVDPAYSSLSNAITIRRGPIDAYTPPDWDSVRRELEHAMGIDVAEPAES